MAPHVDHQAGLTPPKRRWGRNQTRTHTVTHSRPWCRRQACVHWAIARISDDGVTNGYKLHKHTTRAHGQPHESPLPCEGNRSRPCLEVWRHLPERCFLHVHRRFFLPCVRMLRRSATALCRMADKRVAKSKASQPVKAKKDDASTKKASKTPQTPMEKLNQLYLNCLEPTPKEVYVHRAVVCQPPVSVFVSHIVML